MMMFDHNEKKLGHAGICKDILKRFPEIVRQ
jgi:hypothetical protein